MASMSASKKGLQNEIDPLLTLWTTVFDVPEDVFLNVWNAMPPEDRCVLSAYENSNLISSVTVYKFQVQNEEGNLITIAGIANVATLPESRGKGISGQLLRQAIQQIREWQVSFCLLFTGIPELYEKSGFIQILEKNFELRENPLPNLEIAPTSNPDFKGIQNCFQHFSLKARFSTARSSQWWESMILPRLHKKVVFQNESAYVVIDTEGSVATIIEAFGAEQSLSELIAGSYAHFKSNGINQVFSQVPIPKNFQVISCDQNQGMMILPIAMNLSEVQNLTSDAQSRFLHLDHF